MFNTNNHKRPVYDRFIPQRVPINVDLMSPPAPPQQIFNIKQAGFVNYAKTRYHSRNYQDTLRAILLQRNDRVLNFFQPQENQTKTKCDWSDNWPVKPRRKPLIGPPEIVLDMPDFDHHLCHHVADWSSKNCLATIFDREVHMWYLDSEYNRNVTVTHKRVQHCLKWRPDGVHLALGLLVNDFGIWNIESKKLLSEKNPCGHNCVVYCIEWIDNDYLVIGCSKGQLCLYNFDGSALKCLKKIVNSENEAIVNIVASCQRNFIAVSSLNQTVIIWKVPDMTPHLIIDCKAFVRALAWHPWKNSLLGVGCGSSRGRVMLWNINNSQITIHAEQPCNNCCIDALTFNPISGELVASLNMRDPADLYKESNTISVLTNASTVLEELYVHTERVLYLLWGSKGKTLASASADENLCIWNFFGNSFGKNSRGTFGNKNENSVFFKSYIR